MLRNLLPDKLNNKKMDELLGPGNGWDDYGDVLIIYLLMFFLMRYGNKRVELNFKSSRSFLAIGWAVLVFIGNYGFYKMGIMSFLPWVNNAIHCFVWIGFCLSFLYAGCYKRPVWEQCLLFSIFSFIIKYAERELLHTWEQDHFLGIHMNLAYIVGWSILDGLYPFISKYSLKFFSKFIPGLLIPDKP
jgi:hypothetical protein